MEYRDTEYREVLIREVASTEILRDIYSERSTECRDTKRERGTVRQTY